MKELTRAEEQIMQILWKLGEGYVNDILAKLPEPKPAYNTVSTIVRILEKKGFVDHEPEGKTYRYFPLVSKKEYTRSFLSRLVKNYFGNSYKEAVSFFASEENISVKELEEIRKELSQDKDKLKIQ